MARTPVAWHLLVTILAATTMRAAARVTLTGSVFCDRDINNIFESP
eukprot:SM004605S16336  [mRNA]  locus=s4605:156:293:+ [translate_table: standard]